MQMPLIDIIMLVARTKCAIHIQIVYIGIYSIILSVLAIQFVLNVKPFALQVYYCNQISEKITLVEVDATRIERSAGRNCCPIPVDLSIVEHTYIFKACIRRH